MTLKRHLIHPWSESFRHSSPAKPEWDYGVEDSRECEGVVHGIVVGYIGMQEKYL
jgi:hypothetical protein